MDDTVHVMAMSYAEIDALTEEELERKVRDFLASLVSTPPEQIKHEDVAELVSILRRRD